MNKNVLGFGGNVDLAEEAARDLTERDSLLRRVGEFGNQFEHADDAFYQFRPKVSSRTHVLAIFLMILNRRLTVKANKQRCPPPQRERTRLPIIC